MQPYKRYLVSDKYLTTLYHETIDNIYTKVKSKSTVHWNQTVQHLLTQDT